MQFLTLLVSAFIAGTHAVPTGLTKPSSDSALIARQNNPHIADFRVFTTPGCTQAGNMGVFTIVNDDFKNDECRTLHSPYKAITLGDINDGCTIKVFETDDCSDCGLELTLGICSPAATEDYLSYSVKCKGHA